MEAEKTKPDTNLASKMQIFENTIKLKKYLALQIYVIEIYQRILTPSVEQKF